MAHARIKIDIGLVVRLVRHAPDGEFRLIPLTPNPLIEIDHVTFGYDSGRTILQDVNLRFARGKVTSVLGQSGCGKTRCCG